MNLYIIVEGKRTEKKVYPAWIKYVNQELEEIKNIKEFKNNNFILYSAEGIGQYPEVIDSAIADLHNNPIIDYLIISSDSEEKTLDERVFQIEEYIKGKIEIEKVKIIVQNFCIETWALGNIKAIKRKPSSQIFKEYRKIFNVREKDPEDMPKHPDEKKFTTKALFAYDYLKVALKERGNLSYSKKNPYAIMNKPYFDNLLERLLKRNHIKSFKMFIDAFTEN